MNRLPLYLATALCLGSSGLVAGGADQNKTLVVAMQEDASNLDPHLKDSIELTYVEHIYEPLIAADVNLKPVPCLAESWQVMPDGLTWKFKLRKGVKFHNGKPFTADDVVYSMQRVLKDPALEINVYLMQLDTVKKIDDYTVELKTKVPYPTFSCSLKDVMILDKETCEKLNSDQISASPNGTGRFRFVEHVKEDHFDLIRNEDYWGPKPEMAKVRIRPISNDATRTAAILSGDVDLVLDVPVRDLDRLKTDSRLSVVGKPGLRCVFLNFDQKRDPTPAVNGPNPFMKLKVRQAFYHAINADDIIKVVQNGRAYPACTYMPPIYVGYTNRPRLAYDPALAKKLLAEAGYPNGFTVRFDAPNNRFVNDAQVAQAVAGYLEKVGIKVELNLMPKGMLAEYINGGPAKSKASFFLTSWADNSGEGLVLLADMVYTYEGKSGYGSGNRGFYSNKAVDKLIDSAYYLPDKAKRAEVIAKADKISAVDDCSYIPLYMTQENFVMRKTIQYTPRADDSFFAWFVRFNQ